MIVGLPEDKADRIVEMCKQMLEKNAPTIRAVAKLVGTLVATFPAVTMGPLHYRAIEVDKIEALKANKGNYEAKYFRHPRKMTCNGG